MNKEKRFAKPIADIVFKYLLGAEGCEVPLADFISAVLIYLRAVICINLLDFVHFPLRKGFHNCAMFRFEDGEVYNYEIEQHFLELPKVREAGTGQLLDWLLYFKKEGLEGMKEEKNDYDLESIMERNPHIREVHKR